MTNKVKNTTETRDQILMKITRSLSTIIPQSHQGVQFYNCKGKFVLINGERTPLSKAAYEWLANGAKIAKHYLCCIEFDGFYYSDVFSIEDHKKLVVVHRSNKNLIK